MGIITPLQSTIAVFGARCYATATSVMQCVSVCVCVCVRHVRTLSKRINISSNFFNRLVATPCILHCVPKKQVTTSTMITWTRIVRLQQFLAYLLLGLSVKAIDRCFCFLTLPISYTYFTLGNCRNLKLISVKIKQNHEHFIERCMRFWFKISICQISMMHEGCTKWISRQRLESWKHRQCV